MLTFVKTAAGKLRQNLTTLDSQPVSKAALAVVLLLDYFILTSIFLGLADHTAQMVSPDEAIPQHCRSIVIDGDWNGEDRLLRIARTTENNRQRYYRPHQGVDLADLHSVCQPITATLRSIGNDKPLALALNDYLALHQQLDRLRAQFNAEKGAYDTSLLETIAHSEVIAEQPAALQENATALMGKINNLTAETAAAKTNLLQNHQLSELVAQIETSQQYREPLREELRRLNFWYPVKRLGMEMLFLLPLMLLFYLWHRRSTANNSPYQTLVSSHLLVVVFIPLICKILELVYEIIPKQLLQQLFQLLESFNLVAIWHYFVIFAAILTALLVIYLLQKKVFSQQRLVQKRIAKGQCQHCGESLPADVKACPGCGFVQFIRCRECRQETYIHGRYCRACGSEMTPGTE